MPKPYLRKNILSVTDKYQWETKLKVQVKVNLKANVLADTNTHANIFTIFFCANAHMWFFLFEHKSEYTKTWKCIFMNVNPYQNPQQCTQVIHNTYFNLIIWLCALVKKFFFTFLFSLTGCIVISNNKWGKMCPFSLGSQQQPNKKDEKQKTMDVWQ